MTIYIGNFPPETHEDQLHEVFASFGKVRKVNVITDPVSGRGLGFGFVDMFSKRQAQEAVEALNHTPLGGRMVMVAQVASRPERRQQQRED